MSTEAPKKWTKALVLEARQKAHSFRYHASRTSSQHCAEEYTQLAIEWEEKAKEGGLAIGMEISYELNEVVQNAIDEMQGFTEDEFVADELVAALHNARASILRGEIVREEN